LRAGQHPLKTHVLPDWLRRLLMRSVSHRYYTAVVAAIAFAATVTFAFPFVAVLIPAVLLSPRRWWSLGLCCGVASGFGAAVLVEIFSFLGSELVLSRYPDLVESAAWQTASEWLQQWGLLALIVIAGGPVPQTPALFFCALAEVPTPAILVAVAIGKTTKYLFLSWATAVYPARFVRYN